MKTWEPSLRDAQGWLSGFVEQRHPGKRRGRPWVGSLINSASNTTVDQLARALRHDEVDLLLISPERLANPEFGNKIMPLVGSRPGLIVIDEVHCISDWGHDFRPDYRRLGRIVARLAGSAVPILGCTATANDRVVSDVADQLGTELTTFRGPLRRDGLALSTIHLDRQAERLAWLSKALPDLEGAGIIYCLTVRDVENVVARLTTQGITVAAYHGSMDNELRLDGEHKLQTNAIKALVATTALGMGYDKPDLSFVVHFQSPASPVAYYQQVGRAGRALDRSRGILLGVLSAHAPAVDLPSDGRAPAASTLWLWLRRQDANDAVLSGLARGVDQVAMAGALDVEGVVIGVPAEGITKASRDSEIRRRVHQGELCIASPYAPGAPFQAGNAMGRNKIIYALSHVTFVVSSDEGSGGTWAGAKEALDRHYAPVAVWAGAGAKDGNHALIHRGARAITDLTQLFEIDMAMDVPPPLQETLF